MAFDFLPYLCHRIKTRQTMEPNNEECRPDLMAGKKILYVHGFGSSGASGSARGLRMLLPKAEVIAPDLPVRPAEAMTLLHGICTDTKPDLIVGTSMGGMYAEMLYGIDRILINPAFRIADTMVSHNMMGRQEFHNPRADGQTAFLVNKQLIAEFQETSTHCFAHAADAGERQRVYGLFGIHDDLVDTIGLFSEHYANAIRFDGGHYLNDHTLVHALMPVIQWIDDRQQGRERPVLYISIDDTLADCRDGWRRSVSPHGAAVKAFHTLAKTYDVYVLASAPYNEPEVWAEKAAWTEQWLGVPAYDRLIMSTHKNLSYGDYLIDAHGGCGADSFMGTLIPFGEDPYKTWDDVLEFFSRLGGQ